MRITGGKAKGRILQFPTSSKERPTSDFLRETLFNLLGPLEDETFLDLFAGSGSVGIEAASRGAKEIVFIEQDRKIGDIARKNIYNNGFDEICRVIFKDVSMGLKELFKNKFEFDFIFADPPYNRGLVEKTIQLLREYPVLKEKTEIIIQHSTRENLLFLGNMNLILKDQRKYGDNLLTFLKMEKL